MMSGKPLRGLPWKALGLQPRAGLESRTKSFTLRRIALRWPSMNAAPFTVRRASVDDIPALRRLGANKEDAGPALERRLGEMQVVLDAVGTLVGAWGVRTSGNQAHVYERLVVACMDEAAFREMVWQRILTLARNHAWSRIWVKSEEAVWGDWGFVAADAECLRTLPTVFGPAEGGWRVLVLRGDRVEQVSMEAEFEVFQQAQREATERLMIRAKKYRFIALVLCGLVLLGFMILVLRMALPASGGAGP